MWLTAGLGVACLVLAGVCMGQWLRLSRQAEDLATALRWKETWHAEATEATDRAAEASQALAQLRWEHQTLRQQHAALQALYAERTQVALWAGVVRFLMN